LILNKSTKRDKNTKPGFRKSLYAKSVDTYQMLFLAYHDFLLVITNYISSKNKKIPILNLEVTGENHCFLLVITKLYLPLGVQFLPVNTTLYLYLLL